MQPDKKWERVDNAFALLSKKAKAGEAFSIADVVKATGWRDSSVRTYLAKRWREFVVRVDDGTWTLNQKFSRFTRDAFRAHHTQTATGLNRQFDALVEKAVAAAVSAMEVYNKPDFRYRAENFSTLMTNAWELLLKAKLLLENSDNIEVLYARDKNGTPLVGRSGNNRTISAVTAAKLLRESGAVNENLFANLSLLIEVRDQSVHFVAIDPEFERRVHEIGTACVRNFAHAASEWFGYSFERFNFFLMPISFYAAPEAQMLPPRSTAAQTLLQYLASVQDARSDDEDPVYSVALRLDARFVKTDAADAVNIRLTDDPKAPVLRLGEDDLLKQYPYTYKALADVLRARYVDFKQDDKFHKRLAQLREMGSKYSFARRLDPRNPRSAFQRFYHSRAVEAFDGDYKRRNKTKAG